MCTQIIYFVITAMILASTESMNRGDYIPITEAPYFVSFVTQVNSTQHWPYCGGTIISEYWILTAAHCLTIIRRLPSIVTIQVRAGSTRRNGNGDIYEVDKVLIYGNYELRPDYSEVAVGHHDLALFKLKSPITFNEYKQPIKVNSRLPENMGNVTVLGIGHEGLKRDSESLKAAQFQPLPPSIMKQVAVVNPGVLLIQAFSTEACPGDSGSPVVYNGELIGVLIGSLACGNWKPDNPFNGASITRTDAFYDWIMQHTGIKY